jgi:hypothetical protein
LNLVTFHVHKCWGSVQITKNYSLHDSLLLRNPLGGHAGVRELEFGGQGRPAHQGGGGGG